MAQSQSSMSVSLTNTGKQVDLISYKLLTQSLRHILNSFSNSFLEFYSYEGFSSSDIRKNEAKSFALIMAVDMKL